MTEKSKIIPPIDSISVEFGKQRTAVTPVDSRMNFLIQMIGTNRTGKTETLKKIIRAWDESKNQGKKDKKKYSIIGFDPQEKIGDLCDELINPANKKWATDLLSVQNALIVLDDYKILNRDYSPAKGFDELVYRRNSNNVDIICVCHSPALVINFLTYFITHYYIFYTQTVDGLFEKKIPNYQLLITASKMVNSYVAKYGRGTPFQHESGETYFRDFPHIIVDAERGKLSAYNMPKYKELINNLK